MSSVRSVVNVTVVIPCYDCGDTIGECVASIASQTLLPLEVLLVDDGSGPETKAILARLPARFPALPMRLITLPENRGPAAARNAGWNAAQGEFVAFLDADDTWYPQKLEIQSTWMAAHPEVAWSAHWCSWGRAADPSTFLLPLAPAHRCISSRTLRWRNPVATPTVMVRRSVKHRFPEDLRWCEDYALWCDLAWSGVAGTILDVPLARLGHPPFRGSGASRHLQAMAEGEAEVFRRLRAGGRISQMAFGTIRSWQLLKYARRRFLV